MEDFIDRERILREHAAAVRSTRAQKIDPTKN
jgi:hypothetical protein